MKAVPTLVAPGAAATKGGTHGSQQGPVDADSPPLSSPAAPTNVSKPLSSPAAPINVSKPVVEKAAASPKKATTLKEKPAVVKRVSLKWSEVEEEALLEGIEQHSNIDGKGGVRISWTGILADPELGPRLKFRSASELKDKHCNKSRKAKKL